ncbi:PAS domain-containing sensor histidine kinase [Domibacillus iocasae]|uniref:histidine kinase n=2 Tax=Domibacillus iocasae TaxID=1714016 RepID=A0A1E7DKC7_9BACI|nr:PAS domain-containing sensor histidine kinase [Domibacillus iocasae]
MYRNIIDYSVETTVLHYDYKIIYINKSGADFFRTSKEALMDVDVLSVFQPSSREMIKKRIQECMAGNEMAPSIEEKVIRADGTTVETELYCRPVTFGDRKVIQTVFRDISIRKETEKILNNREKLASIGQIAAGIAHEVKNPLTAVKGFLQLLKESHSHPYLQTMEIELDKALLTMQNLLQVSKPDLQEEPLVSIDFCKELESLMLLFQDKLYNVEVEMDLRDRETRVIGKKNLFLKAFFNLIKNALEAISEKGKIRITHYCENQWVHIQITDTGVGIPKEKLNMLGTPFFSSKMDGTGLGLTQVYTTIHEHGGHISVDSKCGEGTTFYIRLPVAG